jgi:hypothetical protein
VDALCCAVVSAVGRVVGGGGPSACRRVPEVLSGAVSTEPAGGVGVGLEDVLHVCGQGPTRVTSADVLDFIRAQGTGGERKVVRIDGSSGVSSRTIRRRVSSVSSRFFSTLGRYLDRERPTDTATEKMFVVLKGTRNRQTGLAELFATLLNQVQKDQHSPTKNSTLSPTVEWSPIQHCPSSCSNSQASSPSSRSPDSHSATPATRGSQRPFSSPSWPPSPQPELSGTPRCPTTPNLHQQSRPHLQQSWQTHKELPLDRITYISPEVVRG